jgi:hypothetical protein
MFAPDVWTLHWQRLLQSLWEVYAAKLPVRPVVISFHAFRADSRVPAGVAASENASRGGAGGGASAGASGSSSNAGRGSGSVRGLDSGERGRARDRARDSTPQAEGVTTKRSKTHTGKKVERKKEVGLASDLGSGKAGARAASRTAQELEVSWVEEEFIRRRAVLESEHVVKRDTLEKALARELEDLALWREKALATVADATARERAKANS